MRLLLIVLALIGAATVAPPNAGATFHFMQIEQVLGGVDGASNVQAIQLRMRFGGQNLVSQSRLIAHDANGANPVLLVDMTVNVANGGAGDRVLIASTDFTNATNPPLTPDFVLTSPIPDSYLPAGSITFESDGGIIYWRVSWGGSGYLGSGSGSVTNDSDGNFNPPFSQALPTADDRALLFVNATGDPSTNNAADYAVTGGASVWTNNANQSAEVISLVSVGEDTKLHTLALSAPVPNPVKESMSFTVTLPWEGRASIAVFDVAGRRVSSVLDGTLSAGPHQLTWNQQRSLSSGVYFLSLEVEGNRRIRRFVVLE